MIHTGDSPPNELPVTPEVAHQPTGGHHQVPTPQPNDLGSLMPHGQIQDQPNQSFEAQRINHRNNNQKEWITIKVIMNLF